MKAMTEKEYIFFQSRYITLEIQMYPYFSTSATGLGRLGQCQNEVLKGLLLSFYKSYNKYHCQDINSINNDIIDNILNDIEILKKYYCTDSYEYKKGYKGLVNSNKSISEIIDMNNLNERLKNKLNIKAIKTKIVKL